MNRICYLSWTKLRALNLFHFQSPPITSLSKFQFIRFCSMSSSSEDTQNNNNNNFNYLSGSDDLNPPASSSYDDNLQEEGEEDLDPLQQSQPPKQMREGITDRLMRLSMQSPAEFVPTPNADVIRINRFADAPFPDQRMKRTVRNPIRKGSKVNYDNFKVDRYENDFPSRDRGYGGGGYDRNDNSRFQNNRGLSRDYDDGQSYSRQSTYGGNNNGRPASRFDNDDYEVDETFDTAQVYSRPSSTSGNYSHRQPPRSYGNEDDILAPSARQPFNQRSLLEDDDDDDEKPRKRGPIKFVNSDNRKAIRDAYMKNFPPGGSRREFHSYHNPGRAEKLPDLNNISNIALNKFDAHNGLSTSAKNLQFPSKSAHRREKTRNVEINTNSPDLSTNDNDDPDVFGNLGEKVQPVNLEDEPLSKYQMDIMVEKLTDRPEVDDVEFNPEDRMNMKKLVNEVRTLLEEQKLSEALDLFTTSLDEGGFRYTLKELSYLYRILISECGKAGHVKMAFYLFSQMKMRGIIIKESVFTTLFNACANSPWDAEKNIERIEKTRRYMDNKGYLPNKVTYNAMIKAYGRCGEIDAAFAIADEMMARNIRYLVPSTSTFCFLLQACISNPENGFRHALFTVDKLRSMRKLRLNIYAYNLLLRAIRECGIAIPPEIQKQVMQRQAKLKDLKEQRGSDDDSVSAISSSPYLIETKSLVAPEKFDFKSSLQVIDSKCSCDSTDVVVFSDSELDAISYFQQPEYRLASLGGLRGFLGAMEKDRVEPDIKTLTELAQIIKPLDVNEMMTILNVYKVKPDIKFFNAMIKNLNSMLLTRKARDVFRLINECHVSPDIYTWGAVAHGCTSWRKAENLFRDMENSQSCPNSEIMYTLLNKALEFYDPYYASCLMKKMKSRGLKPSQRDAEVLQGFKDRVNAAIVQMEKGEDLKATKILRRKLLENTEEFLNDFRYFKMDFKNFSLSTELSIEPEDPWQQDIHTRMRRRKAEQNKLYVDL